ncbi:helix-turn-helix domain-containing protein [Allofustis seminis]|uniref:helix-turn-helix domain-containing protein n=1 Tax=Allofustis seminis TaxID=166939 RepID=UPI000376B290|nr:helix-turn-helix domain-containing protein [Allofustis seminis]
MNERVKLLRETLGLSGEKFGESLGVGRMAISQIETGKNNLTDQMLKLICYTYNVNEDWLRTGQGEMFNQTKDEFLADIQKQYSLSDFSISLIKRYMELPAENRSTIDEFITSISQQPNNDEI